MQMLPRVQITIFLHVLPVAGCPARLREDEERDAAISAGGWETKQIKFPQSLFGTFWHQADPFETSLYTEAMAAPICNEVIRERTQSREASLELSQLSTWWSQCSQRDHMISQWKDFYERIGFRRPALNLIQKGS